MFKPIDLIYKSTKRIEIEPLCYFSDDISKAYSSLHSKGKKGMSRAHKCYQCYYCNKFFILEPRQKRHMENCSGSPGVVYNFNNKNLISYQDNFHAKGDVPFVIYFDFETSFFSILYFTSICNFHLKIYNSSINNTFTH